MKISRIIIALISVGLFLVVHIGVASAIQPGKTIEFPVEGAGKVVFDGTIHADKGFHCVDCHIKIFLLKKSPPGAIKMTDINAGQKCGACHNGKTAFRASDPLNCKRCHKK